MIFFVVAGARYFDKGVFREGDGLDTPLGHPSLPRSPFGFDFKSAQEVSDIVFNINNTDNGNNGRVSHLFMTFGQLMDHDFAYILHPSGSSSGCRARYLILSLPDENVYWFVSQWKIANSEKLPKIFW